MVLSQSANPLGLPSKIHEIFAKKVRQVGVKMLKLKLQLPY